MFFILIVTVLLILFFIYVKQCKYWESKGIPGPRPLPFVGNIGAGIIGIRSVFEIFGDFYRKYEDYPYIGVFKMRQPSLLIRDPELIKNILIKDFNHFVDNDVIVDKDLDPLLSKNTFTMKGEEWKKARQFIAPHFATGKIKSFFPLAVNVSKSLNKYLENSMGMVLNAKDVFTKYNCDVVAICGFGIEGNCFKENSVVLDLAKSFVSPGSLQAVKLLMSLFMPELIKMKFSPESFDRGVIELTKETLRYRKENNIERNDFIGLISKTPSISDIEVAGHMANVILDGFETSSTVLTFLLYELANNPESQTKLRKEINNVLEKNEGELSYESIQDMNYLDACVTEALRLHPPLGTLTRICTQTYTVISLNNEFKNLNNVTLEKGSTILIPLMGLHMDPKYFPSPKKFMPERFLDKSESYKNVYMPFGSGPRMCLGSRFGLMQVKVGIAQIVKNFEIILNEKTRNPMTYDPYYFSLYPKGGIWFTCKKIGS